jgi:hypothetical protein
MTELEPMSIPVTEALSAMADEIFSIDKTLGTQFRVFKSSVSEIYKKVQNDKKTFNAVRSQQMPPIDGLTVPLEKEALDLTGSGMYYGRKVGSAKKIKKNQLFEYATTCGISKYI